MYSHECSLLNKAVRLLMSESIIASMLLSLVVISLLQPYLTPSMPHTVHHPLSFVPTSLVTPFLIAIAR